MADQPAVFGIMGEAEHVTFGPVEIDVVRTGAARVKRSIYPAGLRWSEHLRPLVGTDRCRHAHVGFLAHGSLHFAYADGCVVELTAPSVVNIAPEHDAWVVGDEPAVLIEIDYEGDTIERLGVAPSTSTEAAPLGTPGPGVTEKPPTELRCRTASRPIFYPTMAAMLHSSG